MDINTVVVMIAIVVFLFLHLERNNKLSKKIISSLLISIGILFILPIGIEDFIFFPLFASVSKATLSINLFRYFLLSTLLGIVLVWAGLKITGKNFKSVYRRLK